MLAMYGFHYITKLSVAYHNWAHSDDVIVLQKKSHTSTFEKEKQNFNSIVFMGLRPYGLVKLSSSIVTQVSMWQIASIAC